MQLRNQKTFSYTESRMKCVWEQPCSIRSFPCWQQFVHGICWWNREWMN